MTWITQRMTRTRGSYYTAIFRRPGSKDRTITLGYLPADVTTAALTSALRAHDPAGACSDALVVDFCHLVAQGQDADEAFRAARRVHKPIIVLASVAVEGEPGPRPGPKAPEPLKVPVHPSGGMTLSAFVHEVWHPVRAPKCKHAAKELWWWDQRVLPVLGEVRLCDLDERRWAGFLAGLTICGKSKLVVQGIYRRALAHAHALGWIEVVHRPGRIEGATVRSTAEPEPLTVEEVPRLLDAAGSPMYRALFAFHLGQGLRPGEVIRARWEDFDWRSGMVRIRGTKTKLADAVVPMTPMTVEEMGAFWGRQGRPASGPCFCFAKSGLPLNAYPRSAFHGAVRRAKLDEGRERPLFPYSCRHAFASIAAVSGIDRVFTKQMMRHSRHSTILEEAYEKVSKQQTAAAFANFGMRKAS